MKSRILALAVSGVLACSLAGRAVALDGEPYIHDPSTIAFCDGKYYTFGTGGGGLISSDGWTWRSGAVRPGGGAAPDVLKIGDRYLVVYGVTGGGLGGGHSGRIVTMWNKTLDPQSPDFQYTQPVEVASSDGVEDCDAIDPSLLLDPNDGRLWMSYGTFWGFIRLVELDPKTGERMPGNQPIDIGIDMEATALMYRDGWYYLFGNHGTCCNGPTSTYNIVVGRSKKVTGPYVDNMGQPVLKGGGKMVVAASGRFIGPGHFGWLNLGDGVEKFSCHYEADLDRGGSSVLDIRPLLWRDGWPVAGDNFKEGTYQIQSQRSGFALELAVDGAPIPRGGRGGAVPGRGGRGTPPAGGPGALGPTLNGDPLIPVGFGGGGAGGGPGAPGAGGRGGAGGGMGAIFGRGGAPLTIPDVAEVSRNWPTGTIDARLGDYMIGAHQKWTVSPVPGAGGYLGSPFFKIVIAGTNRALAATADREVVVVPEFTGKPEELWQIDQLTDGTYRIMPKEVPNSKERLALTAVGGSTPSLTKFDPKSDKGRWLFKTP